MLITFTHRLVILKVLARDERGTQLQKRGDVFWSRCLVRRVGRLSGDIEAERPIRFHRDLVFFRKRGATKQLAKIFRGPSNG